MMMTQASEISEDAAEDKQIIFRMPESDVDEFDKIAKSQRMTRSGLLRQCVIEKIKQQKVDA